MASSVSRCVQYLSTISKVIGIVAAALAIFYAIAGIKLDNAYNDTMVLKNSMTDHLRAKVIDRGFQYTGTCQNSSLQFEHNTSCRPGQVADTSCHRATSLSSMTKLITRRLHGGGGDVDYCIDMFIPWLLIELVEDGFSLQRCAFPLASFMGGPLFVGYSFEDAKKIMPGHHDRDVSVWATPDKKRCVVGFTAASNRDQLEQLEMQLDDLSERRSSKQHLALLFCSVAMVLMIFCLGCKVCNKPPEGYELVTTEEYQ